jgi:hypothetical protein
MTQYRQWHQLSPARLQQERELLNALPYFRLERARIDTDGSLTVTGVLSYVGRRSGKEDALRTRIVYPRAFPRRIQRLYDHDRVLRVDHDGHLFGQHELCLTLIEREEFPLGTPDLTEHVLGAGLVRWRKRVIYDRTGNWPGPAERHGINAIIDLLVERRVAPDATTLSAWLLANATTAQGFARLPDRYAPCPCGSGKATKFCHDDALRPLVQRLKTFAPTIPLLRGLDLKLENEDA